MAISDPVADMLTRIRNGAKARFNSVDIPASKLKIDIAEVLKSEGYIKNHKFIKDDKQGILRVYLKYDADNQCAMYQLTRVSKPSRRVYVKGREIKPVLSGTGIAILSTSRGVMTDKRARKENVGGEVLCNIW
ncbi:MAG: 30S ribosomal protein S8 [Desulfobacterales bacterium]|nr:30S ribosomal protein S8 [Desulfobacterales bacterium]